MRRLVSGRHPLNIFAAHCEKQRIMALQQNNRTADPITHVQFLGHQDKRFEFSSGPVHFKTKWTSEAFQEKLLSR
jgi:hypothetical protein